MKAYKPDNYDKGSPDEGQIRASAIVKWVLENGDAYPLPEGYDPGSVFWDIPETVSFTVADWCCVSKGTFAALYSKKASQVSRWIRAGMPVRPDGRLGYRQCNDWIEEYESKNEQRRSTGWRD